MEGRSIFDVSGVTRLKKIRGSVFPRLPSDIGLENLMAHLIPLFIRMVFFQVYYVSSAREARGGVGRPLMLVIVRDEVHLT